MTVTFQAPGRVNLIGEHTDYSGGLVLPMAIQFTTNAKLSPATDGRYRFSSSRFRATTSIAVEDRERATGEWTDYTIGVLRQLQSCGIEVPPFYLELDGDVPLGAGLSSSASLAVVTASALLAHSAIALPGEQVATLCRAAENEFVGSPCGIMDQFVVALAKAGHALLLDTRSLRYEHIPMDRDKLATARLVVCNSLVKHSVATGEYRVRRQEGEAGQDAIRTVFPELVDLGEASMIHVLACEQRMSPESFLRCRHIVTENMRVKEAKKAMLAGDPDRLGELMLLAHASFRDNFASRTAAGLPGCFGARLTGGGFGGCTINLVHYLEVDNFTRALREAYRELYGIESEIYVCEAADGAIRMAQRNSALQQNSVSTG